MARRGRKKKNITEETTDSVDNQNNKEIVVQESQPKEDTSSPKATTRQKVNNSKIKKEKEVSIKISREEMELAHENSRLLVVEREQDFIRAFSDYFVRKKFENKRPQSHVSWFKTPFKERPENRRGQEALLEILADFCSKGLLKTDLKILHIKTSTPWCYELIEKYLPKAKIVTADFLPENVISDFIPKKLDVKYVKCESVEEFVEEHSGKYDFVFSENILITKEQLDKFKKTKNTPTLYNYVELSLE